MTEEMNEAEMNQEGTVEDVSEESEQYVMKGPSLFNKPEVQQPQFDPQMIAQLQQNPAFMKMMKEQEAKMKYEQMTPREKLRAKLKQKQHGRMNGKVKEAMESEEPRKHRKKKANIPSSED